MKNVLVIHEKDLEDKDQSVIGVVDSLEEADKLINKYYGEHTVLKFKDIRDSNLEWEKTLEVEGVLTCYEVEVWLEWFQINQV
jgi:hypothetical protein